MLYKVTPMMSPPETKTEKKAREPGQPRKRRRSTVYDHEGHEVLISLMCVKCRQLKPLQQYGLRKMADGAIRNQPWCRTCRSGAGAPRPKPTAEAPAPAPVAVLSVSAAEAPAPSPAALDAVPVQSDEGEPAAHDEAGPPAVAASEPEHAPAG